MKYYKKPRKILCEKLKVQKNSLCDVKKLRQNLCATFKQFRIVFADACLRHIDSGDISLVNGKTDGNDGKWRKKLSVFTAVPAHDLSIIFDWLHTSCRICAKFMDDFHKFCTVYACCIVFAWFVLMVSSSWCRNRKVLCQQAKVWLPVQFV